MNSQTTKATNGHTPKTKTISFKRIEIARTPVDIAGRKGARRVPRRSRVAPAGLREVLGSKPMRRKF